VSLVFKRKDLPEVGELVIARIKRVFEYGAYADLEEFENLEAFIPWSEVSTRYIRDIRSVLREGQIVVGKVIRVDKKKHPPQIDISIKRVSEGERRVRMMRWKRNQKAQKIIELTAKKLGKSLEEAYEYVWIPLYKTFADVLSILEECVIQGPDVLRNIGLPEEWIGPLYDEARRHIEIKKVKIRGCFEIQSYKPDGVERIKKFLSELESIEIPYSHTALRIYTIGAPRYQIEIESADYKVAEKILSEILRKAEKLSRELGLDVYSFKREEVGKA